MATCLSGLVLPGVGALSRTSFLFSRKKSILIRAHFWPHEPLAYRTSLSRHPFMHGLWRTRHCIIDLLGIPGSCHQASDVLLLAALFSLGVSPVALAARDARLTHVPVRAALRSL